MIMLVLGGNSETAFETAKQFAKHQGAEIILASRNMEQLEKNAKDIELRYNVPASAVFFDADDTDSHREFYTSLAKKPDIAMIAFGRLGDQEKAQADFAEAEKIFKTNFFGAASILEIIAADFEERGQGTIIAMSSVAGERGRKSNYIYGSSKAALTAYLSGLRNRLAPRNVDVITVIPGFMNTKMTDGMELPPALTAEPEQVADDILRAYKKRKPVVYTKWFWRWIMFIIKSIPEKIFKNTDI